MVAVEAALDREVKIYRGLAYASSTKTGYRTHMNAYNRFCIFFNLAPVPVNTVTLTRYVAFLARTLNFSSVKQYLNILRILHLEAGFPNPLQDNWFLQSVLMGVKREKGTVVRQKRPITPEILRQLLGALDLSQSFDACIWAAALVAFFCFFRKSNLLPRSQAAFNKKINLCVGDVLFYPWGAFVVVRWSKTIQYGERILKVPMPLLQGHPLCPVSALLHSLHVSGNVDSFAPLFVYVQRGQKKVLTHSVFVNRLRSLLQGLGLPASEFSGHSFRRGGASFAFEAGVSPDLIKMQGDWRSDAYQRYITVPVSTQILAIGKMAAYIQAT